MSQTNNRAQSLLAVPKVRHAVRTRKQHRAGEMNNLEREYAQRLDLMMAAGKLLSWRWEEIKFRMANHTWFTPDFVLLFPDGREEIHECKGFMEEDAWLKLKLFVEHFPERTLYLVQKDKVAKDFIYKLLSKEDA